MLFSPDTVTVLFNTEMSQLPVIFTVCASGLREGLTSTGAPHPAADAASPMTIIAINIFKLILRIFDL